MRLLFLKSTWELADQPLDAIVERVKQAGYDGLELHVAGRPETPETIRRLLDRSSLTLVAQVFTAGETPDDHLRSLEEQMALVARCPPLLVNCHAGRDYFALDDNLRLLHRAAELGGGVPVTHETHRGRPTYSAIETRKLLAALPDLRLTADFSHWMVVHESDLSAQEDNVAAAIERSDHIHARIGHEQGPQVNDPAAPEWAAHAENHLRLWSRIVRTHRKRGNSVLTVTPEFGPPPYLPTLPFTREPTADVWAANLYVMHWLRHALPAGL